MTMQASDTGIGLAREAIERKRLKQSKIRCKVFREMFDFFLLNLRIAWSCRYELSSNVVSSRVD